MNLTVEEQIDLIGKVMMNAPVTSTDKPFTAALCIDDYKIDKYLSLLSQKYPKVRVTGIFPGIAPKTKTVHLQGPLA